MLRGNTVFKVAAFTMAIFFLISSLLGIFSISRTLWSIHQLKPITGILVDRNSRIEPREMFGLNSPYSVNYKLTTFNVKYRLNGANYTSNRWSLWSDDLEQRIGQIQRIEPSELAATQLIDTEIEIWVDPDDPRTAVLTKGSFPFDNLFGSLFFLVMGLASASWARIFYKEQRRAR